MADLFYISQEILPPSSLIPSQPAGRKVERIIADIDQSESDTDLSEQDDFVAVS